MRLNVANNFETVLTSGITATDTEITVDDATGAPDAPFRLRIDELELIQVNAVSGNTLTVERGVEGTTPLTHSIGAKVELTWTAGVKESMDEELDGVREDAEDASLLRPLTFQGNYLLATDSISTEPKTDFDMWDAEKQRPKILTGLYKISLGIRNPGTYAFVSLDLDNYDIASITQVTAVSINSFTREFNATIVGFKTSGVELSGLEIRLANIDSEAIPAGDHLLSIMVIGY